MNFSILDIFDTKSPVKKHDLKFDTSLKNIVNQIYLHSTEQSGPWIAGGMGRQMAVGENNFNDVDVWFASKLQYEQVLTRLEDAFSHAMAEKFTSSNATTYKIGEHTVQLIRRRWYASLRAVFDDFDFTCCQIAVDDNMTPYGPGIEHARSMVLKLNRYDNQGFLARYAKYVSYGYTMDAKEFLDILNNEDMNYEFDGTTLGY